MSICCQNSEAKTTKNDYKNDYHSWHRILKVRFYTSNYSYLVSLEFTSSVYSGDRKLKSMVDPCVVDLPRMSL